MPIEYCNAVDEMFGVVSAVMPNAAAICGYVPEIRWPGKPESVNVPMDKVWTRVSQQIVLDRQSSLSNAYGKRRFEAQGLIYVQVFCPRQAPSTLDDGRAIAQLIRADFRKQSPSGSILFRNARIVELPPTEENYPINVVSEFVYDEIANGGPNDNYVPPQGEIMPWRKHKPAEPIDGVRSVFTFAGLPDDPTTYQLTCNGMTQDNEGDFSDLGNGQIQLVRTPQVGDSLFAWY